MGLDGLALLLSKSKRLQDLLTGTGSSSEANISEVTKNVDFQTVMRSVRDGHLRFELEPSEGAPTPLTVVPDKEQPVSKIQATAPIKWWRPFGATIKARTIALTIITVVIVALEVVLRVSQHNDGLANVGVEGYIHYVWSYIPALVMVGIGLLFGTLDMSTKIFAPFSRLKLGRATSQDLFVNFLGKSAIESLWRSAKTRYYAVFSTSLAVVMSSYLTIVVSGVYIVKNVSTSQAVDLKLESWSNSSDKLTRVWIATLPS